MKKLLKKLNELYQNIKIEKQYLVIQDGSGSFHFCCISDDVSGSATNSNYEKFKEGVELYKKLNGVKSFVVHNHPKATPNPSLMDYKNADLLNAWATVLGLPLNDYMIFSTYGYYSFFEASEWEVPEIRIEKETFVCDLVLEKFTYANLKTKKREINSLLEHNDELMLIGNKLYYSLSLPLEFIKKEGQNEGVKKIFFYKKKPEGEKTIKLIKLFLEPMTIIEILPDGEWETIL